jgi:hypothetical protein
VIEAPAPTASGRPWHVWAVGIIGGLWSVMSVVSFVLTQINADAVMSQFPPQQREYFASFPLWADTFWAIAVFAGAIGCIFLLLTNRLAVHAFLVSAIGATVSSLGGLLLLGGLEVMRETNGLGSTILPVGVAVLLASYAFAMRKRGVLR